MPSGQRRSKRSPAGGCSPLRLPRPWRSRPSRLRGAWRRSRSRARARALRIRSDGGIAVEAVHSRSRPHDVRTGSSAGLTFPCATAPGDESAASASPPRAVIVPFAKRSTTVRARRPHAPSDANTLESTSRVAAAVATHVDHDVRRTREAGKGGPAAFYHVVHVAVAIKLDRERSLHSPTPSANAWKVYVSIGISAASKPTQNPRRMARRS